MSDPTPDPLTELYQTYPALKNLGLQVVDSSARGKDWRGQPYAGRQMEFYSSDETFNPKPGAPTVEKFSSAINTKDLLGEVFSHLLPKVDPEFRKARIDFIRSIDEKQKEMLRGDYETQLQSGVFEKGNEPTFSHWLAGSGGDAFFRGYIADQYPKELYRQDQIDSFNRLLARLKTP